MRDWNFKEEHMQIKTFEGNFFEIGRQMGQIYKANGVTQSQAAVDQDLYEGQLKVYEKYYPEYLDELRGIADGAGLDAQRMIYSAITGEIFFFRNMIGLGRSCTIFGCKTDQGLFVGRNYDWLPFPGDLFECYEVRNSERMLFWRHRYGLVDPAYTVPKYRSFLPEDAINDKGLFIGMTFCFADQWSYGISSIHLLKLVAETCATVEDALALFARIPACCPKRYFIADKSGNMVTIEHTSKRFKVVYPKDNVLIQTNHYLDPELAAEDTVLKKIPYHNTYIRYYETLQRIALQREHFTFDSIVWILNSPGTYTLQNLPDIRTIWTLAMDMTGQKYQLYWDLLARKNLKS
jgi:isopenicillin-N N-acyltransferase-like protein